MNEFEDDAPNVTGWEPQIATPPAPVATPTPSPNWDDNGSVIGPLLPQPNWDDNGAVIGQMPTAPTRTWASIANDYADIYSDEALSQPYQPNPNRYDATAGIGSTLGRIGGMLSGSIAPESAPGIVREAARPLNYFPIGRGVAGVAKGAGAAFSAFGGQQLGEELLEGKGETAEALGGLAGSLVGGLGGLKGINRASLGALAKEEVGGIRFRGDKKPTEVVAQAVDELTDPVKKLTNLINAAKPARAQTEVLKSQELSRRVARAGAALDSGSGEQAFIRAKSQLSGQLPVAQFDAPRPDLTPDDVASLYNQIRTFPKLRVLEKINTETALTTALAGQIPTRGQLAHLETVFGPEMVEALLKQRSLGTKVWEATLDALNMPRTLVTSVDLSAPFRQGAMMIGHPKEFAGAITPMVKAFAKERYAREVDEAIAASPFAQIKSDVGLYIAPLSRKSAGLGELEEAFMSRALQRGPIKGSQQAYVTFLNKLRSDVFDNWWTKLPEDARTIDNAKRYAAFINAATGRGSLPQAMNGLQPILNATLFSPRYFVSRLQASGMGAKAIADVGKGLLPGQHVDIVSKQIAGDYLKFVGTVGTVIGLASLAGANVETDPRSSDFMKIRVGSTRYDILAGNQQIFRNATNFVTGERKALKSGDVAPVGRNDVILNFIRSKLAPIPSLAWDIGAGSTMLGEEVTPSGETLMNQAWNRLVPFVIQDIRDGAEQEGGPGMFKALPSFFGVGAQSFDPPGATGGGRPARPTRPSRPSRPRRPSRPSR